MLISALGGVILEVVSEGDYFCPLASKDIIITAMQRIRRIETSEIVHGQQADEEQYQPDNASSLPESCLREKTAPAVLLAPPNGALEWKSDPCLARRAQAAGQPINVSNRRRLQGNWRLLPGSVPCYCEREI